MSGAARLMICASCGSLRTRRPPSATMKMLGVIAGAACVAAVPSTMRAFVKPSVFAPAAYDPAFSPVPQIGDLHKIYTGLPDACEVLVKVSASSINPSDITPGTAVLPHVYGSDVSGTVIDAEPNCNRLKVGDRVWGDIGANCGRGKELGAYAEYAAALESQLAVVPENVTVIQAASLAKVALTSYKAYTRYTGAPWNNKPTVLVLGGSGGTGSTGLQLAKILGAGKIITTTSADNFDYCKKLGADDLIDYKTANWWDVLDNDSVDVIYDTVGQANTGSYAMDKLREGGRYVTITGQLAPKAREGRTQATFINSDTNLDSAKDLDVLSQYMAAGTLVMPNYQAILPLSEVAKGFDISKTHKTVGKVVISVSNHTI